MQLNTVVMSQFPLCLQRFIEMAHEKTFKKGDVLYFNDVDVDAFQVVISGRLQRIGSCEQVTENDFYNDKGRDVIFDYLSRGDLIGEEMITITSGVKSKHNATIEAKTDGVIASMGMMALQRFKLKYPAEYYDLLELTFEIMKRRTAMYMRVINEMVNLDARERVRTNLNRLCHDDSAVRATNGIEVRISRCDLGKVVGCSREVAGRVVNELISAGYLESDGKRILIIGGEIPDIFNVAGGIA